MVVCFDCYRKIGISLGCIILFNFSWLPEGNSKIFENYVNQIVQKSKLLPAKQSKVKSIQSSLRKKALTQDGKKC